MPQYLYENPEDGTIVEVTQSMSEPHKHEEGGIEYNRVFTTVLASVDTKIDAWDSKSFIKGTNKKGTIGDLMERSAELSEKRAGTSKIDPVKEKYYESYAAQRSGKPHPDKVAQKAKEALNKMGVSVDS